MNRKIKICIASGITVLLTIVLAVLWCNIRINGHWNASVVRDENGNVIACSQKEKINYPNADVTQLTLVTKHGELKLIDGDKEYIGSYKHNKTNAAGSIYEGKILIDDKSCSCLLAAD